jgi:hypothetical protein
MFSYNCEQFVVLWSELLLMERRIIEQPFKIPFVAAVALYGNEVKPEIAMEAMKRVGDRAQQALNNGEWKEFKLLLRFFACLQPLYQDEGVFTLLGQLFDTVVDLQSANENDVSYRAPVPTPFLTRLGCRHRACQDHPPHHSLCDRLWWHPLPRTSTAASEEHRYRSGQYGSHRRSHPLVCW